MSEVECSNCGTKFDPKENEETVEEEIFVEGEEGYEKKTVEKQIPKCPNCGSNDYEPTSVPIPEPSKEQVVKGWYRKL